ncbi:hypothetical protein [Flavobacterium sp.]|jgi:hypothetical protein|uniref:hypothetical protein n=1 Tax=Flavobacterium sp. TaxID=239 RepID=UPI0037BFBAA9
MQTKISFWKLEVGSNTFFSKGILYILFSIFFTLNTQAQCAMCRASLESEGSTAKAEAINDGIVYLMVIPYVLVAVVGVIVYRMYTKKKES